MISNSKIVFSRAQQVMPGGVSSPVRAFKGVSGDPIIIKNAHGPYLIDVDGSQYIDYVCSWGPLIVGHAHPLITERVMTSLRNGVSFGASTEIELQLATKICEYLPSIEMVRFVNSGTEATMSAIRLARGVTKRNKILKFAGCYHGHADGLLVSAGSGGLTFGVPNSAGVPASIAQETLVAEYNDLDQVTALFEKYGNDIAAIIVEPVAANMNLVLPQPAFLPGLRALCDQYGSLLIFDEVITGFRLGLGGAQSYYQVEPDITVLGKVIGGGFPVAAYGASREIMQWVAPLGPVYQAGTLSGNPLGLSAGLATLELIAAPHFYTNLAKSTQRLIDGLNAAAHKHNIAFHATALGSLFGLFFTSTESITCEADVKTVNLTLFKRFFHGMLEAGIYLAPSAFEIGFMSSAHSDKDIDTTLYAVNKIFAGLHRDEFSCELSQVRLA